MQSEDDNRVSNKPTLLVLAAGMGSRFGGLKQMEALGPYGETILEYSVYDAARAGFGKVVFVIRRDFEEQFREQVLSRFDDHIAVECVFQELDDLPEPFTVPEGRTKPWGTAHAVLAARNAINGPFAVINADDFYGSDSFSRLAGFLREIPQDTGKSHFCMVAYELGATLSLHGTVSRGVCTVNADGMLTGITEREKIRSADIGPVALMPNGVWAALPEDTPVSMNMMGFTPALFSILEDRFLDFLTIDGDRPGSECYLPASVADAIELGLADVKVLHTDSRWMGITYPGDIEYFMHEISRQSEIGRYPVPLWTHFASCKH